MVFRSFFASVLDACFKCFICLQTILQVLYLDVSEVDRALYLPPRFLLPSLGVSSPPSAVLHTSKTTEGRGRGRWRGAPGDGGVDASTRSPLLLRWQE
jgi:hypothetical protein